jgi:hypothetical protein
MAGCARVAAWARIAAPAARVYAIIADYRTGHPRIVPPRWFGPIEVESGGVGAGTVIRFTMKLFGRTRPLRGVVSEPFPGRILVEHYAESDTTTTFSVQPPPPSEDGRVDAGSCIASIATTFPRKDGLLGRIEGFFAGRLLRRIYAEELGLLRSVAESGPAGSS